MADGKTPTLKHNVNQTSSGMGIGMMSRMMNRDKDLTIFQIDALSAQTSNRSIPNQLITHQLMPPNVNERLMTLQMRIWDQ